MSNMGLGITAGLISMGVEFVKIDKNNNTIYVSIPNKSYLYDLEDSKIKCAKDFAKRIKETLIDIGFSNITVKYKIRDIYWTKELSNDAILNFKKDYFEWNF